MAYSKRSKLLPLKMTAWRGNGRSEKVTIHRGVSSKGIGVDLCGSACVSSGQNSFHAVESVIPTDNSISIGEDSEPEPSNYEIESKSSIKHWAEVRKKMLISYIEESSMPEQSACVMCASTAELRCQQCGPFAFYCEECFLLHHKKVNIFHVAEKWKVNYKL